MPVLRTRDPSGGAWRGTNLRTRNTGTLVSSVLPWQSNWDGLTNYWPLNETSGNARLPLVGTTSLIETGGNVASTTGKNSNAAQFTNGSGGYLREEGSGSINCASDWTLTFWQRPTSVVYTMHGPNTHLSPPLGGTWRGGWSTSTKYQFSVWDYPGGSPQGTVDIDASGSVLNTWIFGTIRWDSTAFEFILRFYHANITLSNTTSDNVLGASPIAARLQLGIDPGFPGNADVDYDEVALWMGTYKTDDFLDSMYDPDVFYR